MEVRGEVVLTGIDVSPIVHSGHGKYSSADPLEPKLVVQGDIADGTILAFYVNGVATGQTAEWHSGEVTEVNVTATIEGPPPETTEPPPPETTEPPPPETTESPAPEPAAFSLSPLIISPNEVAAGESVTISVEVTNTGEAAGNYAVTLKIDGVVEASKDIIVNAGASKKVTFTTVRDLPGGYAINVNGLSGTLVVTEGAQLLLGPLALPACPASLLT